VIEDGALLVRDGLIAAVGSRAEVEALPEARGGGDARAGRGAWRCRGLSIRIRT